MSHLIVVTFDDAGQAGEVRKALKEMERRGALSLDDAAVIAKDQDGKIHTKDEVDSGVGVGAVGGGLLGLLVGGLVFPIGGLLLGAAGGAIVGKMLDLGIEDKFVKEVGESLPEGGSALFLLVKAADPTLVLAALKPYKGKVLQTTLPPETEEELRRVLRKKI
jgi:uncharacterized membrane protein